MSEHTVENDARCEPFITQDGYDSGQLFGCEVHGVYEPVMVDGVQTYQVTLAMFQRLVTEHHARVYPPEVDPAPWRHTGPLLPGERVIPPEVT